MIIGIDGNEANVKNRVGSGIYAYELIKQFVKLSAKRYSGEQSDSRIISTDSGQARMTSFVVYLKEKPQEDFPKETENFKYFVFGPKKFWTQFALPIKLTFGSKPNVFFSPAHYGPRFSKIPYVVTIHDLSYLHFPELFRHEDLLQLTNWSKYSIKNSAAIIAPSKSTKEDIVKNYSVSPDKITVTYEGYNKEVFKAQSAPKIAAVKKKYKIVGEYIIFVGTLQPRKNIERLIESFSNLKFEIRNLKLVICGKKGWLYDSILEKSKTLGISNKVIFTDFVPDNDLPSLLSGAKVYVNPSLWEGFGIPVVEAQACGVPVVVSNTSSLPEIVGNSSIFVDPESAESISAGIKKVITDEKVRLDLIKKGNANLKRFSWETCAKETLKILTQFASN